MSKKDYTRFSNNPNKPISNQVIEPATAFEGIINDQIVEPAQEIPSVEPVKEVKGVVVDCVRLNVRKNPEPKAEILCAVDAKQDLLIDEAHSTEDFYKVCTAAGIEGYCMKKFVAIM